MSVAPEQSVHGLDPRYALPTTAVRKAICKSRWACSARSSCCRKPCRANCNSWALAAANVIAAEATFMGRETDFRLAHDCL